MELGGAAGRAQPVQWGGRSMGWRDPIGTPDPVEGEAGDEPGANSGGDDDPKHHLEDLFHPFSLPARAEVRSPPRDVGVAVTPSEDDGVMSLTISCDDCRMQGTTTCDDCVVTFICGREPDDAIVIDVAEERAVRLLADGGLVPRLRHRPRSDCA